MNTLCIRIVVDSVILGWLVQLREKVLSQALFEASVIEGLKNLFGVPIY